MRIKIYIISALFTIFGTASIWASNSDFDNQSNKPRIFKLASANILKEKINEVLGSEVLGSPRLLEETQLHIMLGKICRNFFEENINEVLGSLRFLEETQLHIMLGGTSITEQGIDLALKSAYNDYFDSFKEKNMLPQNFEILKLLMKLNRPLLKKAILKS